MSKISKELGWRFCIGVALIASSYGALLLLPLAVVLTSLHHIEGLHGIVAGNDTIAGKFAAAVVMGKPGVLALKREVLKRIGKAS
jgi:hypothetical protein